MYLYMYISPCAWTAHVHVCAWTFTRTCTWSASTCTCILHMHKNVILRSMPVYSFQVELIEYWWTTIPSTDLMLRTNGQTCACSIIFGDLNDDKPYVFWLPRFLMVVFVHLLTPPHTVHTCLSQRVRHLREHVVHVHADVHALIMYIS